jgi:hypothetical protein
MAYTRVQAIWGWDEGSARAFFFQRLPGAAPGGFGPVWVQQRPARARYKGAPLVWPMQGC